MSASAVHERVRFGDYELDLAAYTLRHDDRVIKLGRQPMDLLMLLVERPHRLVSRQEIIDRLWGSDVFVDVDTGINTAIRKVRQALRDSIEAPAFVETVPGRGYRFIADVSPVVSGAARDARRTNPLQHAGGDEAPPPMRLEVRNRLASARLRVRPILVAAAVAIGVGAIGVNLLPWRWTDSGAGASTLPVALAVLPFEEHGTGPEREHLAAGLTEETGVSLAQIDPDRLRVKGRALAYRGTTKTATEIGQELAVDYLVHGAIRTEGSRVRVTATLLRVRDQEHLWSQTYERQSASVLGLQQELSAAIAYQIRGRLAQDPSRAAASRHTHDAEGYDAYLRGRYLEGRRTPATNLLSIREYERALTRDPRYALAWARLAFTYTASTLNGDARPLDVAPRARAAAARAVGLQAQLAEAQLAAGYVSWLLDWDWPAAEHAFRRATQLDPSSGAAWRMLGHALSQLGRNADADTAMRRALDLEPLEPTMRALSSQVAFQARHVPAAVELAHQAIVMDPEFWVGHMQLGQARAQQGETELALEALADAARLSGRNSKAVSLRGYVLARAGRTGQARDVLRALEADARDRYVPPYAFALVHAGLGERDAAFEWLERAYAARDVHLIYLGVDAKWDAFRDDRRFRDLLVRCGFPVVNGASAAVQP